LLQDLAVPRFAITEITINNENTIAKAINDAAYKRNSV
jgi:hypothetical protein